MRHLVVLLRGASAATADGSLAGLSYSTVLALLVALPPPPRRQGLSGLSYDAALRLLISLADNDWQGPCCTNEQTQWQTPWFSNHWFVTHWA